MKSSLLFTHSQIYFYKTAVENAKRNRYVDVRFFLLIILWFLQVLMQRDFQSRAVYYDTYHSKENIDI